MHVIRYDHFDIPKVGKNWLLSNPQAGIEPTPGQWGSETGCIRIVGGVLKVTKW